MTRIDGPGNVPPRPPANAPKSTAAKPPGKSFDEVMGEPANDAESADAARGSDDKKKDKKALPPFPGGILRVGTEGEERGRQAASGAGEASGAKASGGGEAAAADRYDRSHDRKADEQRADERRAADRKDPAKDSQAGAGGVQDAAAKGLSPVEGAKKAADVQVSRELMQKLVDQVRVGQNKAGNTEVQMDLKSTVFEGMSMKVSKGPEGVLAVLTVDQFSAKQALEAQVADLVSRLEAQGMKVQDIQIELRETPQGFGSSGGDDAQAGGESGEFGYDADDSGPFGSEGVKPSGPGRPGASTPTTNKPRRKESSTDYTL